MLAHRLRRWPTIVQTLGGCVVFAGEVIGRGVKPALSGYMASVFICAGGAAIFWPGAGINRPHQLL